MTTTADKIAELDAKATAGPWDIYSQTISANTPSRKVENAKAELALQIDQTTEIGETLYLLTAGDRCPATTGCGPTSGDNAALIALLRNSVPEILMALRLAEQPLGDVAEQWDEVRLALQHAKNQFYHYAKLHRAKQTDEGDEKACTNAGMGEEMAGALDALTTLSRRNAELEAENARLKVTLVEAAIPLEAMLLSGAANQVSNDLRKGIVEAVQKVRQALGEKNDG